MIHDFTTKHGKLYEKHEEATLDTFYFENKYGKVAHVFLKREVPYQLGREKLYDIITPYGFGGPMVVHTTDREKLMRDYQEAFSDYCHKEKIVSEFIRFHPLENNELREYFDGQVEYVGPQVIRNLKDNLNENVSKRVLKQYRRNKRKGMRVEFDQSGDSLDKFLEIYYSTMNRNNAKDYYYFDRQFFQKLNKELKGHFVYTYILLDDVVISSGLILYDDTYAYGFLGGTRDNYYHLSPNVNLLIEEIKWLKENGCSYYLLGGGQSDKDGIYQFKSKFAKDSDYDFYIGKKIHNASAYKDLVKKRFNKEAIHLDTSFFPAYRAELSQYD